MGSASLTNCITSSMDQEEGFLLGNCRLSLSDARASGPVVELAAAQNIEMELISSHIQTPVANYRVTGRLRSSGTLMSDFHLRKLELPH